MSDYEFVTIWRLDAPIEQVWDAIYHSERWPSWWKGVLSVTDLKPGNTEGIGSARRYVWKSQLPYKLEFDMEVTRIEAPHLMEGRASGEVEGMGLWELSQDGDITTAQYTWKVHTTKAWMNLLAPIGRPFFEWNHNVVMGWGGEGLARLLNAQLLDSKEAT